MTKQSFSNRISTVGKEIAQLSSRSVDRVIGASEENQDNEIESRRFKEKSETEEVDYSLFDCVSFD
jgi:hypothetical protein